MVSLMTGGQVMVSRPIEKVQESSDGSDTAAADVRKLVKQLVNQASDLYQSPAPGLADADDQEVILDQEVNGIRCLLVRSHPKIDRAQVMLSPREQEIARMVAEGYPNKTIAAVLDISSWTVCTHMRRIFAKLNVRSRAAMVARLLEERIIGEHPRQNEPLLLRRK
jgi:two-component system, NarL family, nitrate/nitrite response regulator NarL